MEDSRVLTPIAGTPLDPTPKPVERTVSKLDSRHRVLGDAYRSFLRFSHAQVVLLTAGTTYFVFLAIFSVIVAAFGLIALIGADSVSDTLAQGLGEAFPGMGGDSGIDTEQLRRVGQATSIIGLLSLVYSGGAAMVATSNSLHLLYGAERDPRNFIIARLRLLAWLALIAPMVLLSFLPSLVVGVFAQPVLDWLGWTSGLADALLGVLSVGVGVGLNFAIIYLLLSHLGGIRPGRKPLVIASALGAVMTEILKYAVSAIVSWTLAKPQYGAFAAPIATMLVLFLLTLSLYISAAVVAGISDGEVAAKTDG